MYDNQYDREIVRDTENAIKSQIRLFVNEYLQHIVHYCISNKYLLIAIQGSDGISARINKISTKMC